MTMPNSRGSFALILCSVLVVGGCAAPEQSCVERFEDTTWAAIGRGGMVADLDRFLHSDRARTTALEILGSPARVASTDAGDRLTWIEGRRRSGRTYKCDRLVEETFLVTYAVIDVDFNSDLLVDCNVRLLSFIGPDKSPDPESDRPLPVKHMSCASFVATSHK